MFPNSCSMRAFDSLVNQGFLKENFSINNLLHKAFSSLLNLQCRFNKTSVMAFQVLDPKTPVLSVLGNFVPPDKTKGVVLLVSIP